MKRRPNFMKWGEEEVQRQKGMESEVRGNFMPKIPFSSYFKLPVFYITI